MKRIPLFIFRLSTCFLLLLIPAVATTQDSWPIYRGNQNLTGTTAVAISKAPKVAWVSKMASGTKSSPVIGNNSIFIGSEDGTLYCLSLTGKSVWTFKSKFTIEGAPLFHGNTVYFGNYEGQVFALDAKTGKQRWMLQTDGQISGSPNYYSYRK